MDLEVLVIGGGLQGTHISLALTKKAGVPRGALRVLDPYDEPLARWNETTRNTGMNWLRSSVVQNIDLEPLSIPQFARESGNPAESAFYGRYRRPGLDLFQQHAKHVIDSNALEDLRLLGRAQAIRRSNGSYVVETSQGSISARNVVLALGNTENLHEPEWVQPLRLAGAEIEHIFAADFDARRLTAEKRYAIVGGGSSAIQLAMLLSRRLPGMVEVLSQHAMRVAEFDFDAPWHGPRGRRQLDATTDPVERRELIERSKFGGTIPGDLELELQEALNEGRLLLRIGKFGAPKLEEDGSLTFLLSNEDGTEQQSNSQHTIIATGFARGCPQSALINTMADELGLPLAPCGFPLPAKDLSWGRGLYLMGPHAELEIGPISRNLGGARRAGERIVESFNSP